MGLFDEFFALNTSVNDRIPSVTTALVKENWNEEYPGMIKVEMFLGEEGKNVTGWVPVMTPYGGGGFGYYSLPEVGSEVVVAFNMGDRNCPIVLGCLWNNTNAIPDETAGEENLVKRFKTKGGCEIVFNDEDSKQKIEIKTPAGFGIVLEDEGKSVTVHDSSGDNQIVINEEEGKVEIKAGKTISLSVGGSEAIKIDGQSKEVKINIDNVNIEAGMNLKMKGQTTKMEGASVKVEAQGSLDLQSSGMAKIQGSMVKIN